MLESLSEHFALFYYLLGCLASLLGLFLISLGFPGQFLPGLLALMTWLLGLDGDPELIHLRGVETATLLGLAVLVELIEFFSGILGGKSVGASRRGALCGMLGGFGGGILGNLLLPIIGGILGILLGTGLGAFLGELSVYDSSDRKNGLTEEQATHQALRVGLGSLLGRVVGLVAKLSLAMGCFLYAFFSILALFW